MRAVNAADIGNWISQNLAVPNLLSLILRVFLHVFGRQLLPLSYLCSTATKHCLSVITFFA